MSEPVSSVAERQLLIALTAFRVGAWVQIGVAVLSASLAGTERAPASWAVMGFALAESAAFLGLAWRSGRTPPPWAVTGDLVVTCGVILATGWATRDPVRHLWDHWPWPYSFLVLVGVGLALRSLPLVVANLLLVSASYCAVQIGFVGLPAYAPMFDIATYSVNAICGWLIAHGVRGWTRRLDESRARELASAQAAALANQRLEFVRTLHDHPLQTMELLATGEWIADQRMRGRVAEDAARIRLFVRDGRISSPGDLRTVMHDAVAAAARDGLTVTANLERAAIEVPEPVLLAVAGAVKEALTNVGKHAGIATATLHAAHSMGALEITVADQGRGFDAGETHEGTGLRRSIRERIAEVNGTVDVLAAPGHGTAVNIRIPIAGAAAAKLTGSSS